MSQIVIAIDPGVSGAIAVLSDRQLLRVDDLPITPRASGGNAVNAALLRDLVREVMGQHPGAYFLAAVEDVHAMPGQGVSSMFAFGRSLGQIEAVVQCMALPLQWVRPQAWKKCASLIGADKDMARTRAIELFPSLAARFARKKDVGRADAALIGMYAAKELH